MSTLVSKIEELLKPAVDVRAPYARQLIENLALLIGAHEAHAICYCELSSDMHVIEGGKGCELCVPERRKPFTPESVAEAFKFLCAQRDKAAHQLREDKERLDYIEKWASKSPTGISFDKVPAVGGEPSGFRFMRRHHIGEPRKTLRATIDAEIKRDREST